MRSINDTANSAVRAGLIVSQERKPSCGSGTTCVMHSQELVMKHALGIAIRRKGRVVVDEFQDGKSLRDKCKGLASRIMDKKAKGRFKEYSDMSKKANGRAALKLSIPNDTRVGGNYLMFQSLLRGRSNVLLLENSKYAQIYSPFMLSRNNWQMLSEFEAVMGILHALAMSSQSETPGSIGFGWFCIVECRYRLELILEGKSRLMIIDISKKYDPFLPAEKLPKAEIGREEMLDETKEFITRLIKELNFYLPNADSDQLIALNLHPIMHWSGIRYVLFVVILLLLLMFNCSYGSTKWHELTPYTFFQQIFENYGLHFHKTEIGRG